MVEDRSYPDSGFIRCVNPAALPLVRCYSIRFPRRVASWVNYSSRRTESRPVSTSPVIISGARIWTHDLYIYIDPKASVLPTTPQHLTIFVILCLYVFMFIFYFFYVTFVIDLFQRSTSLVWLSVNIVYMWPWPIHLPPKWPIWRKSRFCYVRSI